MKKKVVVFIHKLAAKHAVQINAIGELGLDAVFFVTEYSADADWMLKQNNEQVQLKKMLLPRIIQTIRYIRKNKQNIQHIEVYPGGRFSYLFILLARLFSIKCICAERGDILYYNTKVYGAFMKFSMRMCYRFADIVWYREPYMKEKLESLGAKKLFFLHNSVNILKKDEAGNNGIEKDIDFLWLNRVIPERKSDWLVEILKKPGFSKVNACVVGLTKKSVFKEEQDFLINNKPDNMEVHFFNKEVETYYKRAKFFVLPSEVVFANHSLLEAMSYGLVPLVSKQQGSEMIVDNQVNGFIFDHSVEGLEKGMSEAMAMDDKIYEQYSCAAINKIKTDFSELKYTQRLNQLYELVQ